MLVVMGSVPRLGTSLAAFSSAGASSVAARRAVLVTDTRGEENADAWAVMVARRMEENFIVVGSLVGAGLRL